ncbi:hypothetical protein FraQA3DRAFT_1038 [Frankia sp. QA3]|nr:hypothetical protein FraQA3DRAFT_1038 [Frankia sp. QA3]
MCRENWWLNITASTSRPFIAITRHRVYGSTASLSYGFTFDSDQFRT